MIRGIRNCLGTILCLLQVGCAATPSMSGGDHRTMSGALELSDGTFLKWQRHIQPGEDELRWTEIPWRSSLAEGLQAAQIEGKPLLLWVMNGHPLGCT